MKYDKYWDAFLAWFGPTRFQSFFGDLTKLQQLGIVHNINPVREAIIKSWAPYSSTQASCCVTGLQDSVQANVQVG